MKKLIGFFLVFLSIMILFYVIFSNTQVGMKTHTFSTYSFLTSTWEKYKDQFINKDGRVIDYTQNGITTSEGQSYAMLRAVWVDDKKEFDLIWRWTRETMKRPNDHLFGWRWGKRSNGNYGFTASSDQNTAADADEDIAFALILAAKRWNNQSYLTDSKNILKDLWTYDTAVASGRRFVIAGNWANSSSEIIVNPSYFAPYEYRIFAANDNSHNWESLIDSGYGLISQASHLPLDKDKAVGLPPDWVSINKFSGQIASANVSNFTTNYGLDAVRISWRLAVDGQWNNEARAKQYLSDNYKFLIDYYNQNKKLAGVYAHDGSIVQDNESPTMYATSLGFLLFSNHDLAKQIYQDKILRLYSNNTNSFNKDLPYYDQNWLWFGAALYNQQLFSFQ